MIPHSPGPSASRLSFARCPASTVRGCVARRSSSFLRTFVCASVSSAGFPTPLAFRFPAHRCTPIQCPVPPSRPTSAYTGPCTRRHSCIRCAHHSRRRRPYQSMAGIPSCAKAPKPSTFSSSSPLALQYISTMYCGDREAASDADTAVAASTPPQQRAAERR
ncbi:hypothetical protein DFH08DRAFT_242822 [Mycena albidolilacea]|uniref:Uncharacterized protein n=1 Tax=Mycena albidolilacea TaxID=1033008 RepID=A0AAD6ZVZ1_9AGAR|nr:hypothetical protein DFH08DRAFT_242822 [Mycena albidolilacea]